MAEISGFQEEWIIASSCLYGESTLQAEAVGGRSICREKLAILKVKLHVGSR